MSKNPSIPDDQANKVREALSKKSIRPEDAIQKAIEELARDIAIIEPKPVDWGWWVLYLLEELETQAKKRRLIDQYEYCLNVLGEKIQDRMEGGKW